ncbi:MAG TPA: Ig-like domain-containing protein [Mycobacteriales bacterium]|nr:Ig-like domain-containing protein [Mycobacteriales bacterium]
MTHAAQHRVTPTGRLMTVLALVTILVTACTGGGSPLGNGGKPATPPAQIAVQPAADAADILPTTPVVVTVTGGRLTTVTVRDTAGRKLVGALTTDATRWTSTGPLRFRVTYTVTAHATNATGAVTDSTTRFSTLAPRTLAYDAMAPLAGSTVGVGMPIRVYFHNDANDAALAVTNKAEVIKHITIRTSPAQQVGYLWFGGGTELHFRPKAYWRSGTQITVSLNLLGVELADGVYGKRSRDVSFAIGAKHVSIANTTTHRLLVYANDRLVQSYPASMGREVPGRYTHNGVHVVSDKTPLQHMDSTTFGLALDAGGYTADVQWATRISNNGEFVHSAPWSVGDQGHANVSHGCINLAPDRARWFFGFSQPGDVVEVTGSPVPLAPKDGDIYDWTIPWAQWNPVG